MPRLRLRLGRLEGPGGHVAPPSSFQDTYPRAPRQYPFFPDLYGQYDEYDPLSRVMAHDEGTFPLFRFVIVDIF